MKGETENSNQVSRRFLMKKIFIVSIILLLLISNTATATELSQFKQFDDVFKESISYSIDDLKYGMICFPGLNTMRAATIEENDLQMLLNEYKRSNGIRLEAPYNDTKLNSFTNERELSSSDKYFYIGVCQQLPQERWLWHNIKMSQICFGGGQVGDVIYGGFGRKKSDYGDDYLLKTMPNNFVWYRPYGEAEKNITEIGEYLYEKYKDLAKPIGDYEGTTDSRLFDGYDGTWDTKFTLPDCLNTEGCSEWAEYTINLAAYNKIITYEQSTEYTNPITRNEFCSLIARLLSVKPFSTEYEYFYSLPYNYSHLENKVEQMGLLSTAEKTSYNDIYDIGKDIKCISALGIMKGVGNGEFAPNDNLTREQMCTIIYRIFKVYNVSLEESVDDERFNDDIIISEWARASVYKLRNSNYINGIGNNTFDPQGLCTKEQAISIVYRLYGKINI